MTTTQRDIKLRNPPATSSGLHITADFSGCDFNLLDDESFLLELIESSASLTGSQILHSYAYQFQPNGISAMVVISASHLSLHTWPQEGFCAVDIYTCNGSHGPEKALEFIMKKLNPKTVIINRIERGF